MCVAERDGERVGSANGTSGLVVRSPIKGLFGSQLAYKSPCGLSKQL